MTATSKILRAAAFALNRLGPFNSELRARRLSYRVAVQLGPTLQAGLMAQVVKVSVGSVPFAVVVVVSHSVTISVGGGASIASASLIAPISFTLASGQVSPLAQ